MSIFTNEVLEFKNNFAEYLKKRDYKKITFRKVLTVDELMTGISRKAELASVNNILIDDDTQVIRILGLLQLNTKVVSYNYNKNIEARYIFDFENSDFDINVFNPSETDTLGSGSAGSISNSVVHFNKFIYDKYKVEKIKEDKRIKLNYYDLGLIEGNTDIIFNDRDVKSILYLAILEY